MDWIYCGVRFSAKLTTLANHSLCKLGKVAQGINVCGRGYPEDNNGTRMVKMNMYLGLGLRLVV